MTTKTLTILNRIFTGLLCLMMMGSGVIYLFNQEYVAGVYTGLGFPGYLLFFNATCKILGGIAILGKFHRHLKEWAYAGYFYIIILAILAHTMAADGQAGGAIAAFIFFVISYGTFRKRS